MRQTSPAKPACNVAVVYAEDLEAAAVPVRVGKDGNGHGVSYKRNNSIIWNSVVLVVSQTFRRLPFPGIHPGGFTGLSVFVPIGTDADFWCRAAAFPPPGW
jgi:hypothetical protein